MLIHRKYSFDSAHFLPRVEEGHKCGRMHGHTFNVEIWVEGSVQDHTEWVLDFAVIDRVWKPIEERLDHRLLNEVAGLANPTSEIIAAYIYWEAKRHLEQIHHVVVSETCRSGVSFPS
jgi:6-pyruvoyltetrahydropterin/6-carboxytetrahydropterin synthase